MTNPFPPGPFTNGRSPTGYVEMGGGYEAAIAERAARAGQQPPSMTTPAMPPGIPNLPPETISPLQGVPPRLPWQQQPPAPPVAGPPTGQPPALPPVATPAGLPPGTDLNTKLWGQNIPPELQGKTIAEVLTITNGLRELHLQNLARAGGAQPPAALPPSPTVPPAGQPPAQPGVFDWKNPQAAIGAEVAAQLKAFEARITPMFAPMVNQANAAQALAARNTAAAQIPNFQQIEPQVLGILQGVAPQELLMPQTWLVAADLVNGRLGRMQPPTPNGTPVFSPPMQTWPPQQVPPGASPVPNMNTWFTETPTSGPTGPQGFRLTPEQSKAAGLMGMTEADYAAWLIPTQRR